MAQLLFFLSVKASAVPSLRRTFQLISRVLFVNGDCRHFSHPGSKQSLLHNLDLKPLSWLLEERIPLSCESLCSPRKRSSFGHGEEASVISRTKRFLSPPFPHPSAQFPLAAALTPRLPRCSTSLENEILEWKTTITPSFSGLAFFSIPQPKGAPISLLILPFFFWTLSSPWLGCCSVARDQRNYGNHLCIPPNHSFFPLIRATPPQEDLLVTQSPTRIAFSLCRDLWRSSFFAVKVNYLQLIQKGPMEYALFFPRRLCPPPPH